VDSRGDQTTTGGDPISDRPEGEQEGRKPPTQQQIRQELAREILRIHEHSYGKGDAQPKALVTEDWVIVVLDDIELLPNEMLLLENGDADTVSQVRLKYQQAIQASFRAAVERATGRMVVGFASANSIEEPRFMAEIFKLG
jgi:uncharacterized protein YbcI